jgi:hypothetical protein
MAATKPSHKLWTSTNGDLSEIAPEVSEHEFMVIGLEIANYNTWQRCQPKTNIGQFRETYGCTPQTTAEIYHSMRVSNDVTI